MESYAFKHTQATAKDLRLLVPDRNTWQWLNNVRCLERELALAASYPFSCKVKCTMQLQQ
jgi:hypothetical protein